VVTVLNAFLFLAFFVAMIIIATNYHLCPTKRRVRRLIGLGVIASFIRTWGIIDDFGLGLGPLTPVISFITFIVFLTLIAYVIGWVAKWLLKAIGWASVEAAERYKNLPEYDGEHRSRMLKYSCENSEQGNLPYEIRQKMWEAIETKHVNKDLKDYFRQEYKIRKEAAESGESSVNYSWVMFIDDRLKNE
jgi:hypothetical protein